jgi:hypothetical protein
MILTTDVWVTVSGRNGSHYAGKGYTLPYAKDNRGRIGVKKGAKILARIGDVHPQSNLKIAYQCDDCGGVFESTFSTIFARKNSQYVKTGETVCSSCANKRMSGVNSGQYVHGNSRYCEYRHSAKKRELDFSLTISEFECLTVQECHYCGGFSRDRDIRSRGNGVDRKDSAVGYQIDNCVPCCATCNFVKNDMPYDDFISYIKRIYNRITAHAI